MLAGDVPHGGTKRVSATVLTQDLNEYAGTGPGMQRVTRARNANLIISRVRMDRFVQAYNFSTISPRLGIVGEEISIQ